MVEGIEADNTDLVKFDIYVNAMEYHKVQPGVRELAGTFRDPQGDKKPGGEQDIMLRTSTRVALNDLLKVNVTF